MRSSDEITRVLANSTTSMQATPFLMNSIPRNWALISDCSTKCFTARAVVVRHPVNLVRTTSVIESIFQVREFAKCCAMELCRQKKLSVPNRHESLYRESSQKGSMEIMNPFNQLEKPSIACSRFI